MREEIYQTLFDMVANDPRTLGYFVTTGRLTKHFDDVPPEACPALYLLQVGENWIRNGKGIPPRRTLDAKFLIYTIGDDLQSTIINNVLDVIDDVMTATNPSGAVTLGGLVEHVYVDGRIIIDEGLLQRKSITVIPVQILIP